MAHLNFEEALSLMNDQFACFTRITSKQHIAIPPKYIGKLKTGVKEHLDADLKLYSDRLGGVIIAYSNIKFSSTHGMIIDEYPCLHLDVTTDFILFKPAVGSKLKAVVNKIGKDHVGCLVHGCFNASINKRGLQSTDVNKFHIGQDLMISVFKLISQNGVLSIKANLLVDSMGRDDNNTSCNISMNVNSLDETGDLMDTSQSDQSGKKKKNKKNKDAVVNQSVSVGVDGLDGSLCESRKKKKKHKKDKHANSGNQDVEIKQEPDETVSEIPSSSKKKKNKDILDNVKSEHKNCDEVKQGDGCDVLTSPIKIEQNEVMAESLNYGANGHRGTHKEKKHKKSKKHSLNLSVIEPVRKAKKRHHDDSGLFMSDKSGEESVQSKKMCFLGGGDADVGGVKTNMSTKKKKLKTL